MKFTDGYDGDLFSGRELRDTGIATVLNHNKPWIELCVEEAERFVSVTDTFTGEDIRFHCCAAIGHPYHHNAWGGLTSALLKRNLIEATGEYRQMRDENSHARSTPVYRRVLRSPIHSPKYSTENERAK